MNLKKGEGSMGVIRADMKVRKAVLYILYQLKNLKNEKKVFKDEIWIILRFFNNTVERMVCFF